MLAGLFLARYFLFKLFERLLVQITTERSYFLPRALFLKTSHLISGSLLLVMFITAGTLASTPWFENELAEFDEVHSYFVFGDAL